MKNVQVIQKSGEIDGKPINWQVLAITGTIDGMPNTLELKLNKTEAMLAKILLGQTVVQNSNDDEIDNFLNNLPK